MKAIEKKYSYEHRNETYTERFIFMRDSGGVLWVTVGYDAEIFKVSDIEAITYSQLRYRQRGAAWGWLDLWIITNRRKILIFDIDKHWPVFLHESNIKEIIRGIFLVIDDAKKELGMFNYVQP
jgi:hypothetical protein